MSVKVATISLRKQERTYHLLLLILSRPVYFGVRVVPPYSNDCSNIVLAYCFLSMHNEDECDQQVNFTYNDVNTYRDNCVKAEDEQSCRPVPFLHRNLLARFLLRNSCYTPIGDKCCDFLYFIQNGLYLALPYAFMAVFSLISGLLADMLILKRGTSTTHVRKMFTCVGRWRYVPFDWQVS